MRQSKDEYLMLREELLHLSTLEDNIINLLYVFVAAMMAFSFTQEDTIFILLLFVVIIPAYRLVISKEISIYKIGAYLYVFHEGEIFSWEQRSSIFYAKLPKVFKKKIPTFNYPFIYIGIFTLISFLLRTDWSQVSILSYELVKLIFCFGLYMSLICMIFKNRKLGKLCYVPTWEEIKKGEEKNEEQGGMIENSEKVEKCNIEDLRKIICKKDHMENYKAIYNYIDKKLENENDKKEQLEALICSFEAQLNKSNTYALIAIGYALLTGICSISCTLTNSEQELVITLSVIILGIIAILVYRLAACVLKNEKKDTFILKALYFKLEEIKNWNNKRLDEVDN